MTRVLVLAVGVWLGLFFSAPSSAQSTTQKENLTSSQIVALIPRSIDGPMEGSEAAGYKKLISMGAIAYPALCAELGQIDNPYFGGTILSIITYSQGDKTLPKKVIKSLLRTWNSSSDTGMMFLCISARALGRIGTAGDAPALLALLDDGSLFVRVNSLRSLAKIGDENTAQSVSDWVASRKASLNESQQLKDPSIHEAEVTVVALRQHIKGNDAIQSASPTKKLSAADIIAMIPRSMDNLPEPDEVRNRDRLLAMGAAVYPVLCSEMLKTDNASYVGNIIPILVEGPGNKTVPRQALNELIKKWSSSPEEDAARVRVMAANALAKIGTSEDCASLLGLLSDPSDFVRSASLNGLKKFGAPNDGAAIQTWLDVQKASRPEKLWASDPSIGDAEAAIKEIQGRSK